MSKLKQAETELALLQRRSTLVLAAAGEGICGFDCEGNVTFANPTATEMLAWSLESPQAQSIHNIFGRDELNAEAYCPIHHIMGGKSQFKASNKIFWRADGSNFPVDFISTPIMEDDKLQGIVVVFSDITQRKLAEQKLNQALVEIKQLKDRLQDENTYLQEQINYNHQFTDILGQSDSLKAALKQVEQVAPTETTVLILGETDYLRVHYMI
ncbi:MAG: PAS domain S-box protein [Methylococcaceae bacterium]|nr:PAS domain S-box protein [Methylococcaceae bacterium]